MDSKGEITRDVFATPAVPLPSVNLQPIDAPVNLQDYMEKHIVRMKQECEAYLEWAVQEIAHWKDKCQELEIELMCTETYNQPDRPLVFKRRRR